MSLFRHDARSINIVRTLLKNNKTVCVIGFGDETETFEFANQSFNFLAIPHHKFSRAYKQWRYFRKQCRKFISNISANVYWASDFYSLAIASKFSKKYGAKLYYDSREIYSAIGSLNKRKFSQTIQTYLEKRWVKSVDKIIVTGEFDKEYLSKHFALDVPIYIIKNFPQYKKTIKSDKIREIFNIDSEKKILLYQGMLSEGRGILQVINALPMLKEFVFCILGDGVLKDKALQLAKDLNVREKVFFGGNVNYSELHNWTCSADIGLSLIEPISFSYELALPNKLFEYSMAGLPTLATELPAMKDVIEKYGIGDTVKTNATPQEIAEKIMYISLSENYERFKSACKMASKELSFDSQENVVMSVFN